MKVFLSIRRPHQLLHEDDAPICFAGVAQRALESCIATVEPIVRVGGGADKARVGPSLRQPASAPGSVLVALSRWWRP